MKGDIRMAYAKPVCTCGTELIYWSEKIYHVHQKINKNGTVSKKVEMLDSGEGAYDRLHCPNCRNQYWPEEDEKGRMIRGETFII